MQPALLIRGMLRRLWYGLRLCLILLAMMLAFCGARVYLAGRSALPEDYRGDAAVVLGAAAWDAKPSPVFRERIRHAVALYKTGKVRKLAFTGGTRKAGFMSEAEVGRRYAIRQGVPARDIIIETTSRNTYQNLANIRDKLQKAKLQKIVIVSDPLHLARPAAMAADLGMNADLSATPTTRYTDYKEKTKFWARETLLLFAYYCQRAGTYIGIDKPIPGSGLRQE
ncbi:MAG: YdcF family protein [Neisseria sp.]|nr:YdcF family protein [Neisseria sp.]